MENKNILIVDDEKIMRELLEETIRRMGFPADTADDGSVAIQKIKSNNYDLIITDLKMPKVSGMDVLKTAKVELPDAAVVILTAYGTIENAVEAVKLGAYDYLTKDEKFNPDVIEMMVKKVFNYLDLKKENRYLKEEISSQYRYDNIIGKSTKMLKIFDTLRAIADSSATVFIQGASGTGKELVARALHYNSSRCNKPFIKTNCAALPEGLMESELFGHEKGAFTGAIRTRQGRFEAANGGTLLLDEISEMSPALQAKLLRVLQEKEFEKVGNTKPIKVDVRIIATTNKDIREEIKKGRFREDLFYRLNVIPIFIPPLKERKKDIPLLVEHFIKKYNKAHNRNIKGISKDALELLMRLDWPGNVRELENRVERAVIMSKQEILEPMHFIFEGDSFDSIIDYDSEDTNVTLREMEKQLIFRTLRNYNNNRSKTAEILGISVRTLRNKLNEYKEKGELDPYFMKGK
ncbi:hypothetical protein DRQ09_05615 [candidate division KSB1 bacterium]|nr:MAG: hypothetical protein DRQ09_05615 [candidate division KSB1 bacterium]